ncbi:MAG: DUF3870 domain-containing protein [Firmicutes bacterium]|uniref:DUF3870 domain-containing protein n=1 Tax=Melghirimyces thermohalophilus TaxID=1236220 RepID=A0A1G6IT82_9BACL|nr:DUF3870 domain-containing protein [Melghirimyces thermohalophilus]MDA8351580.1 DUF3870 domain-containing protein [Bacillota bacterium]SDC09640.1 protein of unknown function [Melghirimyces thermohalophilus]
MAQSVMLAGHAKLPQRMAARSVYDSLTLTVEIDPKYGVILDASCTLATQHARGFIGELLKGHSLREGAEPMTEAIQTAYHGKAQQALIAAIRDLHQQYLVYSEEIPTITPG